MALGPQIDCDLERTSHATLAHSDQAVGLLLPSLTDRMMKSTQPVSRAVELLREFHDGDSSFGQLLGDMLVYSIKWTWVIIGNRLKR